MTKIKTYTIKTPVVSGDKWIGTNGLTGETKNFDADGVAEYVLAGLSPETGGTFKITEIEIATLDTDVATTVNAISPAYDIQRYEIVFFNIEGQIFVCKVSNQTIGSGETALSNSDFIHFPVSVGPAGKGITSVTKTSTVGLVDTYSILFTDGSSFVYTVTNGSNGSNIDVTRTSTTSSTIGNSGSKTLNYTTSNNIGWGIGTRLRFYHNSSNYMEGEITSFSSTSVTITADYSVGTGTYASWNIGIIGNPGSIGLNSVLGEDTSGALLITSQPTLGLDYSLLFQEQNGKVFITGIFTNNTGNDLTGTLDLVTILDSLYFGYAGNQFINCSINGVAYLARLSQDFIDISATLNNGDSIYINTYYFK